MKDIVIIYHKDCPDGFGGAWAAWKKFKNKAEYLPMYPRIVPPDTFKNKEIYVIDNSYPVEVLKEWIATNKKVVVLDHHESAKDEVLAFPQNIYDNDHSGAVIAWKYFHPKKPVPQLLKYVEDVDLWKNALPHTKELNRMMMSVKFDLARWDTLAKKFEGTKTRAALVKEGEAITRYFNRVVEDAVDIADHVQFGKHKVYASNFSSKRFTSDIGNILATKYPPFAIIWNVKGGVLYVSMRSDGSVDVAKIAAKYGGGGHKAAAAFKIPFTGTLPWKILKRQ